MHSVTSSPVQWVCPVASQRPSQRPKPCENLSGLLPLFLLPLQTSPNAASRAFSTFSALQKGPAEKGPRRKASKIVQKCHDKLRHFSTTFAQGKKALKIVKKFQKYFSTLFDNFCAAPFFRPLFGGSFYLETCNPVKGTARKQRFIRTSQAAEDELKQQQALAQPPCEPHRWHSATCCRLSYVHKVVEPSEE